MNISKNAVAGGVTALGGTGAVAGVVIANQNKETIEEKLKNDLLPTSDIFNTEWDKKVTDLTAINQDDQLKHDLKKVKESTNKKSSLQGWCEKKGKEYSSNTELLDLVKKWCVVLIKDKLGNTWKLETEGESSKSNWEIKLKILKSHTGAEPKLTNELKDLKDKQENSEEDWKTLRDACKPFYETGFTGNDKDNWKLANAFCTKPTIKEMLNGTELPDSLDAEWTTKTSAAKENTNTTSPELKTKLSSKNNDDEKKTELKKWCNEQYSKPFDSVKTTNSTLSDLLAEAKKWCALTIKEKLDSDNSETNRSAPNNDSTSWEKNAKKLNSYSSTTPTLTDELKTIKGTNTADSTTNKDQLKKWCEDNWNKGYKGESEETWKMADQFCRKNPQ